MSFSVQTITNQGSGQVNEDEFLVKDNLFAVFDGATSFNKFLDANGKTGGRLASEITKQAFSVGQGSLIDLAVQANEGIAKAMEKAGLDLSDKKDLWCTSFAAARLNNNRLEVASISDSLVIGVFKDGSHQLIIDYVNHDLESLSMWKDLAGKRVENIRDHLQDQFNKVRRRQNIDYGVLNGEPVATSFIKTSEIDLEKVSSIIIFTDGMIIPTKDPAEPEKWDKFVELYKKGGLKEILKYIRALEELDPNCWEYPRLKQYDDATAIAIDFK